MKVLVVEDDITTRSLFKMILRPRGHDVTACEDAESAWEICQQEDFQIIILDWMLTGLDGLGLCRRIRAMPNGERFVILICTARDAQDDIRQVIDAGADDYLAKPIEISLLKIRLALAERNAVLKNAKLSAERALAEARAHELEIGSRIQKNLLFGSPPQDMRDIEVATYSHPSQAIDGDFYDFFRHNDRCFDLVIGDVMGKGVPAALLGAATKNYLIRAVGRLISESGISPPKTNDILDRVQTDMADRLMELDSFVTLCYARFDLQERTINLVDCGHTKTIHYCASKETFETLRGENVPLGVLAGQVHKDFTVHYEPGDLFFFYSDGLTEACNPEGDFFGEERLAKLVSSLHNTNGKSLIETVVNAIKAFSQSESFNDDLTCAVVRILDIVDECVKKDTLKVSSDLKNLSMIRFFIRDFCEKFPGVSIDADSVALIELAANEAASNITRHAYKGRKDGPITVDARAIANRLESRLEIRFIHEGLPFVPPPPEDIQLHEPRDGGMGLYILSEVMDEVSYFSDDDGNQCVRLVHKRDTPKL